MKNHQFIKILAVLSCFISITVQGVTLQKSKPFKTVAYQKFNTMAKFDPKVYGYIDQLIYKLLRVKIDGELELLPSTLTDIKRLVRDKQRYNQVKLLIGIGGAKKNSAHFSVMAANPIARSNFVENITEFCQKHQLDGVDIDWEYPETHQEQADALVLFEQLQKAFKPHALMLTAAITYTSEQVHFAKQVEPFVHQINLMVYEPIKGLKTFQQQIDFAVELIEKEALMGDKLVVGLPFYGKNVTTGKTMAYNKIIKAKQLGSTDISNINYMNVEEVKKNTLMMKERGYSGVMFWELGFDTPITTTTSLLRSIHSVAK